MSPQYIQYKKKGRLDTRRQQFYAAKHFKKTLNELVRRIEIHSQALACSGLTLLAKKSKSVTRRKTPTPPSQPQKSSKYKRPVLGNIKTLQIISTPHFYHLFHYICFCSHSQRQEREGAANFQVLLRHNNASNSIVNIIFNCIHKILPLTKNKPMVGTSLHFLLVYLAMQTFKVGNCCQNLIPSQGECQLC